MVGNQPEVTVRPKVEGLHTDLVIPATSASGEPMNYVIKLTSDQRHYTPLMGVDYPGHDITTWNQQASALMKKPDRAALLKNLEQDQQWVSGQEKTAK
jgi:type IV secretion system protein VirB9